MSVPATGSGMYGLGETVEFLATEVVSAPDHVAEALQLDGEG